PHEDQLPRFLEEIALVSDVDEYQDAKPAATLITMHAVKGLEFPIVFMTGMEEGVFPHARSIESGSEAELEEERGLCFVGIPRAATEATRFRAGDRVTHPSLGEAMVVSSVVRDDDEEVTVAFPDRGVKKLMASYAKLARA